MNKTTLIALAAATTLAAALPAAAQDTGNWIVRARAVHLDSANKDRTGLDLTINNRWLPEVDISYFFTPNLAAELVLTYPQKQTVSAGGGAIGSFKHLPPTLTAQYHFTGLGSFRPYLGAGINYTRLSSVRFDPAIEAALAAAAEVPSVDLGLKRNSVGLALQAGVDVPLGGGWLLNADIKKVHIGTKVLVNGGSAGKFKIDPLLVGLGIGKRF